MSPVYHMRCGGGKGEKGVQALLALKRLLEPIRLILSAAQPNTTEKYPYKTWFLARNPVMTKQAIIFYISQKSILIS